MLRGARIFEALSKKEIGAVARVSREVQHNAGDEIVREGTPGVGFHLILAGRARVTKKGRKLRELGPGDSFGDISIVDGGPRTASVVAETPLRLLSILAWEFKPPRSSTTRTWHTRCCCGSANCFATRRLALPFRRQASSESAGLARRAGGSIEVSAKNGVAPIRVNISRGSSSSPSGAGPGPRRIARSRAQRARSRGKSMVRQGIGAGVGRRQLVVSPLRAASPASHRVLPPSPISGRLRIGPPVRPT